jgi:L-threonylcarbamoyladenylate synthase
MAEVLVVDPAEPAPETLARAAAVLRAGGLVAFPTETFYGLGAAALRAGAVRALFAAKGRPEDKPVLLLVDSLPMAERVAEVSPAARRLMERYWPGPLTLVLPARAGVPAEVTASTGTVGVRLSPHPVARGLVRALGEPVTAPSANRSGAPPPTAAAHVLRELGEAVALVLDGGPTPGGPPSTVLDLTVHPARVLRAGAVRVEGDSA